MKQAVTTNKARKREKWSNSEGRDDDWNSKIIWYLDLSFSS